MTYVPFRSSRLKVERAIYHIDCLERDLSAYAERQPLYLDVQLKPGDPNYTQWHLVVSEPAPLVSPILGDAIHNLRTSLDLLACEIMRFSGQSDKSVHFPFAHSEDDLEEQIKRWKLDRANPAAIDMIRALKPFKGGNSMLRAVHDLDLIDKHRELIGDWADITWPYGGAGFRLSSRINALDITSHGETFTPYAVERGFLPGEKLPAKLEIRFPDNGPFPNLPLIPTLRDLPAEFHRIIDAFETLLFGAIPNPSA